MLDKVKDDLTLIEGIHTGLLAREGRSLVLKAIVDDLLKEFPQKAAEVIEHHLRQEGLADRYHRMLRDLDLVNERLPKF